MIEYTVKRSNRKTVTVVIHPGGGVEVRCPCSMTDAQIRQLVADNTPLIEKRLREQKAAPKETVKPFSAQELATLTRQAKADLTMRVVHYAPLVGVTYGRITVRHQRTRWGSCSTKANLNFNCLLILLPPHIRDYVVVHERCHRKHMNHSPQFWAEVAKHIPDHAERRAWLRKNGSPLIARLPK